MEVGDNVELIGVYYGDDSSVTKPLNKAIGWDGLKIGRIRPERPVPYLIV